MALKRNFLKQEKKFERNVKELEKSPLDYNKKEWLWVLGGGLLLMGIFSKMLNIQHWIEISFDMSSYHPYSPMIYVPSSLGWIVYSHYRKEPIFLIIGLIGLLYSLLITVGVLNTHWI